MLEVTEAEAAGAAAVAGVLKELTGLCSPDCCFMAVAVVG